MNDEQVTTIDDVRQLLTAEEFENLLAASDIDESPTGGDAANWLMCAIDWSGTKQGHLYWSAIHDRLLAGDPAPPASAEPAESSPEPCRRIDGGPAFPTGAGHVQCGELAIAHPDYPGMTLRDYFAAKAIQGTIDGPASDAEWMAGHAAAAYAMADAMLAALEA